MPLGPGIRYRVKTTKSGKKVRLAFRGNKVVEAKRLEKKAKDRERGKLGRK
jgi:hypothetical protein